MSYKEKPQIKLYKYQNNNFVLQAIIDDYQECSFECNLYQAGTFTVTINYNIPNSHLFQRGLFIQFGNDPYDFGEIATVQDSIGQDGKGSQIRTITGYDARYLLKRRVIKNMNSNGLWVMTAKGELCLRNLVKDQCGSGAEEKRRLPITNTIPASADAIGEEYSVSEQFTNLYEVCSTIATQSEIGWRIGFDGTSMYLNCYKGTDRSQTVKFSTSFDSLANGKFVDSSESFCNAVYVGGKGDNEERDIYEGEDGTPSGLDRFESWDNQAQMTTEEEYEIESKSILSQYGQTVDVMGNGLAKCPYIYKEQYNVGDLITIAFSGKSAVVQILSVTERWTFGNYDIQFSFGKPINGLTRQLQNMLRKIQEASNKTESTTCVKWYTVTNTNSMPKADVTFNTLGFTGAMTQNKTFTLYLDNERTGSKNYTIYTKNLTGNYTLTLTTGKSGATNFVLKGGVNAVAKIYIDPDGNIIESGMTATSVIETGNNQPLSSDGATALQPVDTVASGNLHSVTSNAVAQSLNGKTNQVNLIGVSGANVTEMLKNAFDLLSEKTEGSYNGLINPQSGSNYNYNTFVLNHPDYNFEVGLVEAIGGNGVYYISREQVNQETPVYIIKRVDMPDISAQQEATIVPSRFAPDYTAWCHWWRCGRVVTVNIYTSGVKCRISASEPCFTGLPKPILNSIPSNATTWGGTVNNWSAFINNNGEVIVQGGTSATDVIVHGLTSITYITRDD